MSSVAYFWHIHVYNFTIFDFIQSATLILEDLWDRLYRISCECCLMLFCLCFFGVCFGGRTSILLLTWQIKSFRSRFSCAGNTIFPIQNDLSARLRALSSRHFVLIVFLFTMIFDAADTGIHPYYIVCTTISKKEPVYFHSFGFSFDGIVILLITFKYSIRCLRVGGNCFGYRFVVGSFRKFRFTFLAFTKTDIVQIASLPDLNS